MGSDPIETKAWRYGARLYATEAEALAAAASDEATEVMRELRRLVDDHRSTERRLRALDAADRRGLLSVLRQVGGSDAA